MRTKSVLMCLVGLLLLSASSLNAEMRKWTKTDGTTIEAEFVSFTPGKGVVLRQADGTEMTVKLPGLSEEDRKYVRKMVKSQGKPETKDGGGQKTAEQPAASLKPEMRKWTRKNGKEFEAEFVKREGPVVTLKKPDGKEMTVKMPGLSEDDREYVKQHSVQDAEKTAALTDPGKTPAGEPKAAEPAADISGQDGGVAVVEKAQNAPGLRRILGGEGAQDQLNKYLQDNGWKLNWDSEKKLLLAQGRSVFNTPNPTQIPISRKTAMLHCRLQ